MECYRVIIAGQNCGAYIMSVRSNIDIALEFLIGCPFSYKIDPFLGWGGVVCVLFCALYLLCAVCLSAMVNWSCNCNMSCRKWSSDNVVG